MKKGQMIRITDEKLKVEMAFAEMVLGSGESPSFEGELLEVYPTPEEYARHDENFKAYVEAGQDLEGISEGVVYFDTGVNRAFWIFDNVFEVVETH